MNESREQLTGADAKWGYRFGCEGLVSLQEARQFLAGISASTLWRRCKEGRLRKGTLPGGARAVICRKSLMDYAASMED